MLRAIRRAAGFAAPTAAMIMAAAMIVALGAPPANAASPGWSTDHDAALAEAAKTGRPIVVDMWATWCTPCLRFSRETLPDPAIEKLLDGFVRVKLDMDAPANEALWKRYGVDNLPRVLFLSSNGQPNADLALAAFEDVPAFSTRLRRARAAFGLDGGAPVPIVAPAPREARADEAVDEDRRWVSLGDKAVARTPHVAVRLITDREAVESGGEFEVGLHFELEDGWHIYWRYPGDAGLPTRMQWTAADGSKPGPWRWPVPHRFEEQGGALTTYGYADEALLHTTVAVESDRRPGDAIPLALEAHWLVCRESCIPGTAKLETQIRVDRSEEVTPQAKLLAEDAVEPVEHAAALTGWKSKLRFTPDALRPGALVRASLQLTPPEGTRIEPVNGDPAGAFIPLADPAVQIRDIALGESEDGAILVEFTAVGGAKMPDSGATDLGGVVRVRVDGRPRALFLSQPISHAAAAVVVHTDASAAEVVPFRPAPAPSLWQMLLFALVGGILLNVMPCVLPVLSIKVLGLVHQAGEDGRRVWHHGLAYGAGVLASFWVLAALVIGLKASGELVGWGFQFQNPWYVVALTAFVFGFGLSMFGVFEITLPGMQVAARAGGGGGGLYGSFMNGVFATLLATPCTAPFLGPALGYAFTQPSDTVALFLTTVGVGLAAPFVILARFPAWTKRLPRPGAWMETFKQAMGFLLMGTVVWLLDVVSKQIAPTAFTGVLVFLLVVAFASWIYGRVAHIGASGRRQVFASVAALAMIVGGARAALTLEPAITPTGGLSASADPDGIAWQRFSPDAVEALQAEGKTVFIDFTAAWCVTCKVNESTVIETDAVRQVMGELDVVALKADYTNKDATIATWLRRFDRVGVPLYVLLPGARPDAPIVLPEILTQDMLLDSLRKAGPSQGG